MDILSAVVYGIIQGLTEFLPISSSGHLALLPHFLKIQDPGVIFDLAMHIGTVVAVVTYFRKEVLGIIKDFFAFIGIGEKSASGPYVLNLLISTGSTVILAFIIKYWALRYGRSVYLIAGNLVFFGILMFIADYKGRKFAKDQMSNQLQTKKAILIGVFQALAIFPGVSRSGSTLTISRFMGLSRLEATRYSFILSLPVIVGAFLFKIPDLFSGERTFDLPVCLLGGVVSFLIGIIAIHFFLKFIQKAGLWLFSLYRIVLAVVIGLLFFQL